MHNDSAAYFLFHFYFYILKKYIKGMAHIDTGKRFGDFCGQFRQLLSVFGIMGFILVQNHQLS